MKEKRKKQQQQKTKKQRQKIAIGNRNYSERDFFKHLHSTATCFDSYNPLYFKIIHKANSKLELKTKGALHINA